jgi:toxin-antitoxin system PIN domain toxin
MRKTYLPDVNFWLALVFQSHVHHVSARTWFDSVSDESCCYCRLTQQGFLRLANNPKAFPNDAVTTEVAWQLYDTIRSDSRVTFVSEPDGLEADWRRETAGFKYAANLWTDAYLSAFARVAGHEFVTFDNGFESRTDLAVTVLT